MATEITRHIFDGGWLDMNGTDRATEKVLDEGRSSQSFRMLLGQPEESKATGQNKMYSLQILS